MRKILKVLLGVVVFAAPLLAQDQAEAARMAAGCGANETQFTVKRDKKQHPTAQPDAGKALVYVFGDEDIDNVTLRVGSAITRWGVDGTWVGASDWKSYFYFAADPGDHRLCIRRQSSFKSITKISAALSFTAEAGKVYYFRAKTPHHSTQAPHSPEGIVELVAVDPAEAQLMIANSPFSVSHPKPAESSTADGDNR